MTFFRMFRQRELLQHQKDIEENRELIQQLLRNFGTLQRVMDDVDAENWVLVIQPQLHLDIYYFNRQFQIVVYRTRFEYEQRMNGWQCLSYRGHITVNTVQEYITGLCHVIFL